MGKVTLPKPRASGIPPSERAARAPSKAVLRFAPKAVLTPDEYKTSLDVEGAELTAALVDHVLLANIVTTDRYLPGLQAVAGGADPDASIVAVERGS